PAALANPDPADTRVLDRRRGPPTRRAPGRDRWGLPAQRGRGPTQRGDGGQAARPTLVAPARGDGDRYTVRPATTPRGAARCRLRTGRRGRHRRDDRDPPHRRASTATAATTRRKERRRHVAAAAVGS